MSTTDLSGRVAVVTGAGRGLGLAYATALARAGALVVVNDADEELAGQAAKQIAGAGGTAIAHPASVGTAEAADGLVAAALEAFCRLDILVTNAGILRDRVLWKMTDEDFDAVIGVHLRGTFTCARAAVRHMRESGGGRLILVGSPAGQRGNFGQTNYAAAKAGIAAMVRTWSMECTKAGITGQCVGIGGDRLSLWSHPQEIAVAFRDGGWDHAAIADAWPAALGGHSQTVGIPAPGYPGK
jgi:NAD(P)-dependent dehydrogenase (short-subunit alcohol dehydrogenase family)